VIQLNLRVESVLEVSTHVFRYRFYTCFYCDEIRRAKAVQEFEEEGVNVYNGYWVCGKMCSEHVRMCCEYSKFVRVNMINGL